MELLIIVGIIWILPCYIAWEQGKQKHRLGLAWGLCLGWLGVIALALLPPARERERLL